MAAHRITRPGPRARRGSTLGGWRVALRMAWRDIAAAKGRSALVMALIGLPVVVLVAGLVVAMTGVRTPADELDGTLGGTPARIEAIGSQAVEQFENGMGTTGPAKPLPAPMRGDSARAMAQAVAPLLPDAHLVPVAGTTVTLRREGIRTVSGDALRLDAADAARPALAPLTALESGRYPTRPDEVAVTTTGLALGLPRSGTIDLRVQGGDRQQVTVVGVVSSSSLAVAVLPLPDTATGTVLVDQAAPVTYADMKRLNGYGIQLTSRAVTLDPPPGYRDRFPSSDAAVWAAIYASMLAGLLLEMCLLAGPAFAIGAQRQRRTLALAASNGATRRQLRTVVLAQAIVLGALTALAAAVLGVLVGIAGVHLVESRWPLLGIRGEVDIPWLYVLAVTAAAGVACVVAALVPARGLGRLDVVAVLRGQSVSPRAHRGLPVLGLVLAVVGGVAVVWPIVTRNGSSAAGASIVIGSFLLVIGAIMLVPMILVGLGRLTRRLPVAGRMATRDATRQRGRAVPTAASLIGGAALLAAVGTAISSSDAAGRRDYTPELPAGWATISGSMPGQGWDDRVIAQNAAATAELVHRAVPQARLHPVGTVGDALFAQQPTEKAHQIGLLRATCTPAHAQRELASFDPERAERCLSVASEGPAQTSTPGLVPGIVAVDPDVARTLYSLDDAAVTALREGAVLSPDLEGERTWVRITTATSANGDGTVAVAPGGTVRTVRVPSLAKATNTSSAPYGTLVTAETAAKVGWPVIQRQVLAERPGGFSAAEEDAMARAADDSGVGSVRFEHGYRNELAPVIATVFGVVGLLSVIAVVVATALSVRESRRDLDTLTSVGAPRGMRRRFAAWQAAFLAAIGTLLGYAIGLVPGIALCWPASASPRPVDPNDYDGPWTHPAVIIAIPWTAMALTLFGVIALSALVAAALAGREGSITRRLS